MTDVLDWAVAEYHKSGDFTVQQLKQWIIDSTSLDMNTDIQFLDDDNKIIMKTETMEFEIDETSIRMDVWCDDNMRCVMYRLSNPDITTKLLRLGQFLEIYPLFVDDERQIDDPMAVPDPRFDSLPQPITATA